MVMVTAGLWKYGKEFTLSYNCIAATKPLPTTLPIWRINSSLWSNFFLLGKKAFFALWFVDICWSNHRNIRLMLCKTRSCSNQTEMWESDHFFGSGFYTIILSVREDSVFCIMIWWHWFVHQNIRLMRPAKAADLQQSNRSLGVGSFFLSRVFIKVEHNDILINNCTGFQCNQIFELKRWIHVVLLRIQCHLEHLF